MLTPLYVHHAFYRPGVTKISVVLPTPDMPYINRSRTIATAGERVDRAATDLPAYGAVTAVSFLALTRHPLRFVLPYAWAADLDNCPATVSRVSSRSDDTSSSGPTPAVMSLFETHEDP